MTMPLVFIPMHVPHVTAFHGGPLDGQHIPVERWQGRVEVMDPTPVDLWDLAYPVMDDGSKPVVPLPCPTRSVYNLNRAAVASSRGVVWERSFWSHETVDNEALAVHVMSDVDPERLRR